MKIVLGAILIVGIVLFILIKRDEKKQKEYCEKHVTEIVINDKFFGEVKCEKDNNLNSLSCKNLNRPFSKYNPKIVVEEYEERNNELYFRSLECVYSIQQEIATTMMDAFLEMYGSEKEVTRETLKQNFEIDGISIYKCMEHFNEYFLAEGELVKGEVPEFQEGDWVLVVSSAPNKNKLFHDFYSFEPTLYMNCRTKIMCYVMEE